MRETFKIVPLQTSFMVMAILGFLISAVMQPINISWTFAFCLIFLIMFFASMISMSEANPDEQLFPIPPPEINMNVPNPFKKPKKKGRQKKKKKRKKR